MDHKFKSKWESNSLMFDKGDYGYDGISWRQRNFMCNFCKKEYKSAQALGGHMNVHRRDRARLRLSSPSLLDHHPNPNPNPNPNIFSSPPASNSSNLLCLPNYKTTFHSSLFPLSSPSLTVNNQVENIFPFIPHDSSARNFLGDVMRKNMMNREGSHDVANFHGSFISNGVDDQEKESRVWKRRLEMDLLKDHGKINDQMGLDLELRLGRP